MKPVAHTSTRPSYHVHFANKTAFLLENTFSAGLPFCHVIPSVKANDVPFCVPSPTMAKRHRRSTAAEHITDMSWHQSLVDTMKMNRGYRCWKLFTPTHVIADLI